MPPIHAKVLIPIAICATNRARGKITEEEFEKFFNEATAATKGELRLRASSEK